VPMYPIRPSITWRMNSTTAQGKRT
jgi:hypothetical protein